MTEFKRVAIDTSKSAFILHAQPSPHFDTVVAGRKRPVPDTASANFWISGKSRCSGMFGISS